MIRVRASDSPRRHHSKQHKVRDMDRIRVSDRVRNGDKCIFDYSGLCLERPWVAAAPGCGGPSYNQFYTSDQWSRVLCQKNTMHTRAAESND